MAWIDPRGTVGSIYQGEYYTLVRTTYESSGPYGFREEDFYVLPTVSIWELLTSRGGAISDPMGHSWQDLCKASHNNAAYQI